MADLQPWSGKAGQLRVGHKVFGSYRTANDVWEVLAFANGDQIITSYTLWTRVRNLATGEELSVPPRLVTQGVTFALTEEELEHAERYKRPPAMPIIPAVDVDAVRLLVEQLGAQDIATLDIETGEAWCPNYATVWNHHGVITELEHLRIAHGFDISGLEAMEVGDDRHAAIVTAHGREHGHRAINIGRGGFPHRHVPEDHTYL